MKFNGGGCRLLRRWLPGRVATTVGTYSFPPTEPEPDVLTYAHRFRPSTNNMHAPFSLEELPGGSPALRERLVRPAPHQGYAKAMENWRQPPRALLLWLCQESMTAIGYYINFSHTEAPLADWHCRTSASRLLSRNAKLDPAGSIERGAAADRAA